MDNETGQLHTIDYNRIFPWLHMFRAFRIAFDVRKMMLAGMALMLLAGGDWVFSKLPFAPDEAVFRQESDWPSQQKFGFPPPRSVPQRLLDDPGGLLKQAATNWRLVLKPMETFIEPAGVLLNANSTPEKLAFAVTRLLWALIVWALFGAAITRMAAVQFAREERISMRAALSFSRHHFLSYLAAPLLPVGGMLFLLVLCFGGGWIGRIPVVGDVLVGALWFLPLALGFVMALILLGVAAGWPLMYAAIGTEGSDGFDGFNRAYNYVFSRPWYCLWLTLIALVYGSIVIFFVTTMASLVVYLAGWGVASGMGVDRVAELAQATPELLGGPTLFNNLDAGSYSIGSYLVGFWLQLLALLIAGFVYSYFWTAATIAYSLLRHSDDATELDEVYLPEEEEVDDLLPLVGVAASEQPAVERPAGGESSAANPTEDPGDDT